MYKNVLENKIANKPCSKSIWNNGTFDIRGFQIYLHNETETNNLEREQIELDRRVE